jgi:putative phosphoribosyl transferase
MRRYLRLLCHQVGAADTQMIALNRSALAALRCEKELAIVPGATHLFEEPGALDKVADLATLWFSRHLIPEKPMSAPPA